ncbi:MAG: phosphoribosyltransferase family protein [Patescibacteria group bacterium]|nr:hypothetical protein [Patescibacteria group bacterium]
MIVKLFAKINVFLLEILFPRECLGCGRPGTYFCGVCAEKLCTGGRRKENIVICKSFDEAPYLKPVIHHFKYHFAVDLARPLGGIMRHHFKKYFKSDNIVLVPVPLHKKRLRMRSFNQSELLAREIGPPIADVLKRTRDTKPQAKLGRADRLKNLTDAFGLKPGTNLEDKVVVIVDDVYTTGSTIKECERALRNAGVREIYGIVIASGC